VKIVMFSKHLSPLTIEEAARTVGEMGFDGLDLTVRPGGHIEPENALEELPKAVELVRSMGYDIPMITTGITRADEPYAEDIFAAASTAEVSDLKLGYWRYEGFGSMRRQVEQAREDLDGLAALAEKYSVRANLHVHSGDFLTADGGVLWYLLLGRDPDTIGAYIDPGHMTIEGGVSVWKMSIDLLTPWINLVAIKDMAWTHEYDEELGKEKWVQKLVPLTEGVVRWPEVFRCLHEIGFDGTISVHSEYQGAHSWKDLTLEELLEQTREDFAYIKGVMASIWNEE